MQNDNFKTFSSGTKRFESDKQNISLPLTLAKKPNIKRAYSIPGATHLFPSPECFEYISTALSIIKEKGWFNDKVGPSCFAIGIFF